MPDPLPRDSYSPHPQFSQRDVEVLRFLGEEGLLGFSFEGLRRRLGTHSETLSRILHRLEEEMILEKTVEGYHLTHKGRRIIETKPLASPRFHSSSQRVSILRTLLPYGSDSRAAISRLKGRWFGPLRWLGYSEDEGETTMKWVTADGGIQINAIFSDGELSIEGSVKEGKDLTDAIRASYQLLGHMSRFSPTGPEGHVAFFSVHN